MKRIKLIISTVCVALAVIICAVMVQLSNKNFVEDVFVGSNIDDGVDEYLISQGYEKFPEKEKGIWLIENKDTDFDKDSEKLTKVLEALEKSVFDSVYVRSEYFSASSPEGDYSRKLSQISALASALKQQGKKVYLEMHTDHSKKVFSDITALCDGIILRNDGKMSYEKFNHLLSSAVKKTGEAETFVYLPFDYDISKLNKKAVDGVCTLVSPDTDMTDLSLWDKTLKLSDSKLICSVEVGTDKEDVK
ncbi:MAG: hypothetical protein IKV21_01395, partial [Clostridia bacterium]|nr:hypothetical protein [Clostridia bacterium]